MDPIPVLSQIKSLVQVTCGDREAARQTQINFSRQCPVVSQARSAVEAITGDQAAARETQKEFLHFVGGVVNSVPVVGHISGGIHYAVGDKAGGDQAMKAASRTTAVMAGGIGGVFIAGPVGAIGLGILAGAAIDSAISGIDTAVHWKKDRKVRPFGLIEPFSDPKNAGKWFDAACGVAMDGVTGLGAGTLAQQVRVGSGARGSPVKAVKNGETVGAIRPSPPSMTVFMKVLDGALYIMTEKAKEIGRGYVIQKITDDVLMTVRLVGHKISVRIKDKKVHIKDPSGNDQVLQVDKGYTLTHTTGKVEVIQDKMMLDCIERIDLTSHRCIKEREEKSCDLRIAVTSRSIEVTKQGSNNASSVHETEDESSDESYIEDTEEKSSDCSSIEETADESSAESSTEVTGDESGDDNFVEETEDESSDESSIQETRDENSDASSIEEAEDDSSDESSIQETGDESSSVSSVEETEDESSNGSSIEENEEASSDESSSEETGYESSDESSD